MFVGYADDHAGDVYRFMNVQTKKIIMSRDAKWLNLFWKHYKMRHNNPRRPQVELFLDVEENLSLEGNELEENRIEGDGNNTIEQRKLGTGHWYDWSKRRDIGKDKESESRTVLTRNESMERAHLTMEDWIQETCLISAVTSGPTEPKTFQEVWHGPIEKKR